MHSYSVTSLQHIFYPSNRRHWGADVSLCHTCTHSSRCLFWHKGFLLANRNALMRIYEGVTIRANIWNTPEQACTVYAVHTAFVPPNTRLPFCGSECHQWLDWGATQMCRPSDSLAAPPAFTWWCKFRFWLRLRRAIIPQTQAIHSLAKTKLEQVFLNGSSCGHLGFKKKIKIAHWFESRRGCFALIGGMVGLIKKPSHLHAPSPGRPLLHRAVDSIDWYCCSSMSSQKCRFQCSGDSHTPAVICAKRSWIQQILSQYGIWCGSTNRRKHLVWDELLAGRYSL